MKSTLTASLIVLALVALQNPVAATHREIKTVQLESTAQVAAPPATVWTHLTTGKNLVTWCPVWKSETNANVMLKKVGDVLDFTDQWGNGGRSIVTYLDANKEIRVAHEPNDGSYVCQAKISLMAEGTGTKVVYHESYTDDRPEKEVTETAMQMDKDMAATLAALKAAVEKK